MIRRGVPLSDPVTLFIELGTILGRADLVAIGDALVLDPAVLDPLDLRPWVSLEDLSAGCASARSPGSRRARSALIHVRQGAESRPETLLRLLLIGGGLPEPELNVELRDRQGGRLGRFDLVYRLQRVIVEYDGEQHRTSDLQYDRDLRRLERAREVGWTIIQVRWRGLFRTPEVTVARVRRALSRA